MRNAPLVCIRSADFRGIVLPSGAEHRNCARCNAVVLVPEEYLELGLSIVCAPCAAIADGSPAPSSATVH